MPVLTLLPDPTFNPDNKQKLTSSTKLAPGITIGKFAGCPGNPTPWSAFGNADDQKNIARQLYLQAQAVYFAQHQPAFANHTIQIMESIFQPIPGEVVGSNINEWKQNGRSVVYQVVDSRGEQDWRKMFELAVLWKDYVYCQHVTLSYDTFDPSGVANMQVILTMPTIDHTFTGNFTNGTSTWWNYRTMSSADLMLYKRT